MIQLYSIKGFEDANKNIWLTKDGFICKITEKGVRMQMVSSQINIGGAKRQATTTFIFGTWRFGYKEKARYTQIDKGDRVDYYNVKKYKSNKGDKNNMTEKEDDISILKFHKSEGSTEAYNLVCKRLLKRKGKEYLRSVLEEM